MILTKHNYFSLEAHKEYMSFSQFKSFLECEYRAMGGLSGEVKRETSKAQWVGKLLHAWNEGVVEEFIEENREILYQKTGKKMYKEFEDGLLVIKRIEEKRQQYKNLLLALQGQKEVILSAELWGMKWKIMIDSYNPERKRFADLKVMKGLYDKFWDKENRKWVGFAENYKYNWQMAIYSEIERLANNREERFNPFIAVITKEVPCDTKVLTGFSKVEDGMTIIEKSLADMELLAPRVLQVKSGLVSPNKCGVCEYYRETAPTGFLNFDELI